MLTEPIIEFELRWPEPCSPTCTLTTGSFHEKKATISSPANFLVDYYLLLKYCWRQCTLLSLNWDKSHTNLIPKCKILIMFWA